MRFLFFILLLLIQSSLNAQQFHLRESFGQSSAVITSVYPTDSMYYITGAAPDPNNFNLTSSSIFARFDLQGNLVSQKIIHADSTTNLETWTSTLQPTDDGNLIVAGYAFILNQGMKAALIKYNDQGDTIWKKFYNNPFISGDYIRTNDMMITPDSGFIVVSTIYQTSQSHHDISVIKTDNFGNIQWNKTFGDSTLNDLTPTVSCFDTFCIISWGIINNNVPGWPSIQTINQNKVIWINNNGDIIDSFISDTINNTLLSGATAFTNYDNNSYYFTPVFGTETGGGNIDKNAYIFKLDSNKSWVFGKKITHHTPSKTSKVSKLLITPDSNLLAIGTRPDPTETFTIGFMMKLTPNGDSLWQRNYAFLTDTGDYNDVFDARKTADGGYIICGESTSYFANPPDPVQQGWLLKVDSLGCLVPGCHLVSTTKLPPDSSDRDTQIDLHIYPNPATDYINLYLPKIEGTQNLHLHLYNLQGQLLQNHPLPQSDMTYILSTEGLSSGAYVVQVLDDEGRMLGSEKVIIE